MKTILIPTDFSTNAYNALLFATRFFQQESCVFYLLHTFEVQTSALTARIDTTVGMRQYQELEKESQDRLMETKHRIVRDTENMKHSFKSLSISKKLVPTINKVIKNKTIDYVVMGTQGATGAKGVLFGSNAVKVIKEVQNCPVIAIPERVDFTKPAAIIFPTNYQRLYLEEELLPILDMARIFKSQIHVIYIAKEEKLDTLQIYNRNELAKQLSTISHTTVWIEKVTSKSDHIQEYVEKTPKAMLTMINHKHSFLTGIMREPVVKKMGLQTTVPFLIVPEYTPAVSSKLTHDDTKQPV